jgi:hypothetical protein
MAADTTVDLVINQKSDFTVTFAVKDNGVPIDLTGYSVQAKLKPEFTSPDSLAIAFTTSVTNAAAGTLTLNLTSTETAALTQPRYYYDTVITSNSGFRSRIVEGKITISKGIT